MAPNVFMRSLCFLLLSTSVISAPSQSYYLNGRDDNTAGIGVELEWRGCEMVNSNPGLKPPAVTDDQISKLKGTGVVIKDLSNAINGLREWKMTAEHFGQEDTEGIYKIVPEFIVDGTIVKVGDNKLEQIGQNIMNFLGAWLPYKAHDSAVLVPGFETYGTWNVQRPDKEYKDINTPGLVTFGTQFTVAMPLAGIHACFVHAKGEFPSPDPMDGKKNPLIPDLSLNTRNMHLVEASHVDPKDKKGKVDLSPESLGFFSIVVSYAKAAANGVVKPDAGIKHTIPIMPRTDFAKLYKDYVEPNLKQVFDTDACDYSLYNVVKKLSEYKGDGSNVKNFDSSKLDTEPIKWNSHLVLSKSLKIKEWMDGLQYLDIDKVSEYDKAIDGQIGGYGRKTEKLYSSSVSAPLFEFRDLSTNGIILPKQLKAAEEAVMAFHKAYNQAPPRLRYRDAKSTSKADACTRTSSSRVSTKTDAATKTDSASETTKTGTDTVKETGSSKTATDPASKTGPTSPSATKSCPEGKRPSKDGKDCITKPNADTKGKCPDGKILDPEEGGQTKDTEKPVCINEPGCKDDEVPSQPLYKPLNPADSANCVKKPADDKACGQGQYKLYKADGDGKATAECTDTRKTTAEKKKKDEDDKKKKEEENKKKEEENKKKPEQGKEDDKLKEKKKSRVGFCMALVASSELLPPEEIPGQDDIKDAAAANDAWPKDLEYKEMEMTNSNIEKGRNSITVGAIQMDTAGPNIGALFKAIFGGGKSAAKSAAEAGVEAASRVAAATAKYSVKAGKIGAKAGGSIKKIKEHPSFLECLAAIPTWVENNKLHLGDEVPKGGFKPQATGPYLHMWDAEDGGGSNPEQYLNRQNYDDDFWHVDRLMNDQCVDLNFYNDKVTAFDAHKTCCTFYREKGCKGPLFAAFDREDGELKGKENDVMSSFMCTESGCGGHPK
ncbi:hypothetical protein HYFRA_00012836 [Hymenoscyphus fraxineus]|uniref:Uncharacterized protein n=1 Tax=Hymenoscyphus fraxineus TaxID=746836 RepID=A0A9N9L5R8_9HELO|nr:hypothetical protein HYFRA_00012836 [Hymenoscyphus fraxineus]